MRGVWNIGDLPRLEIKHMDCVAARRNRMAPSPAESEGATVGRPNRIFFTLILTGGDQLFGNAALSGDTRDAPVVTWALGP